MNHLVQLEPRDEFNLKLESHVHPPDWSNPTPGGRYNLVVIGAGTAGLVTAAGAAGLGARVALIERDLMGGDCLNVGCVPSKAIISAARKVKSLRTAGEFGVTVQGGIEVDFAAVMQRMRRLRAQISHVDSAQRFSNLGVDVYLGGARFVDARTVEVAGRQLKFKSAVIAAGARAAAPPIPGLSEVDYLTNETLFSLTELPKRLGVIGAGPIGCEMAQSFALLGSEVYLIEAADRILPREDADAAKIVHDSLVADGVNILCCGHDTQIQPGDNGSVRLTLNSKDTQYDQVVDKLLVAVGRAPNVENLGLDAAGVKFDNKGVSVNDLLQTSNPRIFAAGDISSRYQFTHAADFMARIVIQNALFPGIGKLGRASMSSLTIPWSTYTSPEIAHVGMYADEARQSGSDVDTFVQNFDEVDRAILEGEPGMVKVHVKKGTDKIIGATVVATNAGDMISEITLAMTNGLGLKQISKTIHPYPTQADAIRKVGDLYNKTRLTPRVSSALGKWMKWTR